MSINFFKSSARAAAALAVAAGAALLPLSGCATAAAPDTAKNAAKTTVKKTAKPATEQRKAANPDDVGEFANFNEWKEVSDFIDTMSATHGFDRTELENLFRKVRYVDTAIQLIKPAPPGKPKNWRAYRARFVEPVRIRAGVNFWETHADALARAEERYGVPSEIIVGIIGVETVYGRNTGNFRVLDALTTLAFDYPPTPTREARMKFFRGELENTLLFARETQIDPFSLFGSYAGAIGWPQFMPGSIRKYAVDFDNDGKIDLRKSPVDAIGSVANFLVEHGWKRGEPTVFPATVSAADVGRGWDMFLGQGLEAKYKLDEIKAAGVTPTVEPPADMPFGLVDLQNGGEPTEYWLGAGNFFAITHYNRSFFYAMSVIDLGRAVRSARGG
ncbi:lytic murein transglycosylase B [Noviherbaspirillum sp. CPCC 100848]|uniref:Lytic murein transglycosylase B n=1 Tax=Noviherbaspirillum album TaxID=3080276 RepID=A0ABU6J4X9_9BURK|nr:lytic murein transglycosylase B [Noviherbaspirillum sp. CPCC 100848]MEC4718676.1 lytic murein transglycosylase B [Noviherbaspirillum sp. CPCC 100848]